MNLIVVIIDGPDLNTTLATVKFDKFGNPTKQPIIVCNNANEGFVKVKHDYEYALFVASGTVFSDWFSFYNLLQNYPHKGLIGHIICHNDDEPHLHEQCYFISTKNFDSSDFELAEIQSFKHDRSTQNLHDDYTPLWIKKLNEPVIWKQKTFGQGLIAKQFKNNLPVVNWNNSIRDIKFYKNYDNKIFDEYKKLATNQLWIFNNEPIKICNHESICSPASGLFWIFNIIQPKTKSINLVDISQNQLMFAKKLWYEWDGNDFGWFVNDFVKQNKIVNYQLDDFTLTQADFLKFKKSSNLINYCDKKFSEFISMYNIDNFLEKWLLSKDKEVNFINDNIIDWSTENYNKFDKIWISNICDYKWTLLSNSVEKINQFKSKINDKTI